MKLRLGVMALSIAISLQACTCVDESDGWEFEETPDFVPDFGVPFEDVGVEPDLEIEPDMAVVDPTPESVVPIVPRDHALTERTSLAIDDQGTVWLGFHRCQTEACLSPELTIARRARGGDWSHETIKEQRGTFGIDVAVAEQPMAAFLDPTDNTFKVARRVGVNDYDIRTLPVQRTGPSDGLDIAADDGRMFVSFTNELDAALALCLEPNRMVPTTAAGRRQRIGSARARHAGRRRRQPLSGAS